MCVEFRQDVLYVIANCVEGDVELRCYVFVRLSSGEVSEDLSLASSKSLPDCPASKALENAGKFAWANHELPSCHRSY